MGAIKHEDKLVLLAPECQELHPVTVKQAFGWSDTTTAFYLGITERTMRSYQFRASSPSRRNPDSDRLQLTWERTEKLLKQGAVPVKPELLPPKLRQLMGHQKK
ncbi:hypothetical protein [Coleofasciculus sp. FACHB-129]|uniref:hypothetical protein n=1 Tax=Cyanophyceae TaxID=3028117 RepID=UPI001689F423|nr:hypothetical protein [Coleofasciculus sp. FACHB-129]MBD1895894.1 hypothetical protein [Coleofasciculus sp. FACHB-129]